MHRPENANPRTALRIGALLAVVILGLVGIVGSGGGGSYTDPICVTYPDSCGPLPPTVSITPERATVQVGGSQTFSAQPSGFADPAYQWQRSSDGGHTFADTVGATTASYTLAVANLRDDATVFQVLVRKRGGTGTLAQASSRVAVSSSPGVVFQDGEFASANWQVTAISVPPNNGATHTEEQSISGGNPAVYRRMTHTFPPNQQSLGVMNLSDSAVYDPAISGAILAIDYSEDCALFSAGNPTFQVYPALLIEQAGRRFRPHSLASACTSAAWTSIQKDTSLAAVDFDLLDGPACGAAQACPDFSASAPPIRFGFVRFAAANGTSTVHGIDNWKVTVWRR
jgi:hypothetical protein